MIMIFLQSMQNQIIHCISLHSACWQHWTALQKFAQFPKSAPHCTADHLQWKCGNLSDLFREKSEPKWFEAPLQYVPSAEEI